ncbi:sarcosine oxidase subunit gamma family protein [Mesorhizobium sp. 1B3]|uniref:sarcosine oxidase subunit gamma family protein n=1 Tax=Mesorhizobium sp. 1B3 TaxID=3243599 RepID=UPI003D999110
MGDLFQTLVSGNLDVWSAGRQIGLDVAPGPDRDYAVRVARDRLLAVTAQPIALRGGWNASGYATTDVSGGYLLLEISGSRLPALLSRATTIHRIDASPSAAIRFAGIDAVAYLLTPNTLRLHVDSSLSGHLWSWLQAADQASSGQQTGHQS